MALAVNTIICGDWIDVLKKKIPNGVVHVIITSPPYWGQRNYGVEGQLGLEKTPEEHIEKLVVGFREIRRVLRDDGVVWLNYGDKYSNAPLGHFTGGSTIFEGRDLEGYIQSGAVDTSKASGLPQGNLLGLAWRLALALQADGWLLRSDIIWAKALSFCDVYSGSTMPESVNGWRWEQHRVTKCPNCGALGSFKKKICQECGIKAGSQESGGLESGKSDFASMNQIPLRLWADCPGCPKCEPNGGLVLRKGSWRPTRAHEYLFLLAKSQNYFCDMEAVREEGVWAGVRNIGTSKDETKMDRGDAWQSFRREALGFRNLRDVWCINPQSYPDSHYATFPERLVEPCIKAGTSEKGCCPKCGAPWARIVDTRQISRERPSDRTDRHNAGEGINSCGNTVAGVSTTTLGWRPTCKCFGSPQQIEWNVQMGLEEYAPVPCVVLDPFCGSGTVCAVAASLGRNYIGIELNEDYIEQQAKLRVKAAETGIPVAEQRQGQKGLWE